MVRSGRRPGNHEDRRVGQTAVEGKDAKPEAEALLLCESRPAETRLTVYRRIAVPAATPCLFAQTLASTFLCFLGFVVRFKIVFMHENHSELV